MGAVGNGAGAEAAGDYPPGLRARDVERFQSIVSELKEEGTVGLAALSVAARELASLADRTAMPPGVERRR